MPNLLSNDVLLLVTFGTYPIGNSTFTAYYMVSILNCAIGTTGAKRQTFHIYIYVLALQ